MVVLVHMPPRVVLAIELHGPVSELRVARHRVPGERRKLDDPQKHARDLRHKHVGPASGIAMDVAPVNRLHGEVIHFLRA